MSGDSKKDIVEVVGNSACKPSDRIHFLRLLQLNLKPLASLKFVFQRLITLLKCL